MHGQFLRTTYFSSASTDTSLSDGDLFVSSCHVARKKFDYLLLGGGEFSMDKAAELTFGVKGRVADHY